MSDLSQESPLWREWAESRHSVQQMREELDRLRAENARLLADHAAALRLVADVRAAIGDGGKRMQPELIEYCTQAREALRRVHRWCLTAYDAGVAAGVRRWIEGGMIGKLPPMPKWILECYPEERAIDVAALAKANGGGNG